MDIALVVVIITLISAVQSRHLLGGDEPLPQAELTGLDGSTIDLSELDARRTIIYFWAPWCGACELQSGAISKLHDTDNGNLDVISVVLSYQSREEVERHVEENGIDYPVYLGTKSVHQRFNISSFPTVYIVDDDERIRHGLVGYTTRFGLIARTWF